MPTRTRLHLLRIWVGLAAVVLAGGCLIRYFIYGNLDFSFRNLTLWLAIPTYQTLGILALTGLQSRTSEAQGGPRRAWGMLFLLDAGVLAVSMSMPGSFGLAPLAVYLGCKAILDLLLPQAPGQTLRWGGFPPWLALGVAASLLFLGSGTPLFWILLSGSGLLLPALWLTELMRRPSTGLSLAVLLWFPVCWLGIPAVATPGLRSDRLATVALSLLILAASGLRLHHSPASSEPPPAETNHDRVFLERLLATFPILLFCFGTSRFGISYLGFQTIDLRVEGLVQAIWIPLCQAVLLSLRGRGWGGFSGWRWFAALLLLDGMALAWLGPGARLVEGLAGLQFLLSGGVFLVRRGRSMIAIGLLSAGYGLHILWPFLERVQTWSGLGRATPLRWVLYLVLFWISLILLGREAKGERDDSCSGWLQVAGLSLLVAAATATPGYFLLPFLISPWDLLVRFSILLTGAALLTAGAARR